MQTPDINHRFAGWRESVKLVTQVKGELVDVADANYRLLALEFGYEDDLAQAFFENGVSIIDSAQSIVQRARVLLAHLRKV